MTQDQKIKEAVDWEKQFDAYWLHDIEGNYQIKASKQWVKDKIVDIFNTEVQKEYET